LIILDSYAWIKYFLGSDFGRIVKEYLESEEASTPSIVLATSAELNGWDHLSYGTEA
jgi:hypothetical protein